MSPSEVIICYEACCGDSFSFVIALTSCQEDSPSGDLNDHVCLVEKLALY